MNSERVQGIAVVRPNAASDTPVRDLSDQWGEDLCRFADQLEPPHLVVDLSGVEHVGPRAMASLLRTHRQLQLRGGRLILASLSGDLANLFQITRFGQEMCITPTCAEALQLLNPASTPSNGP